MKLKAVADAAAFFIGYFIIFYKKNDSLCSINYFIKKHLFPYTFLLNWAII